MNKKLNCCRHFCRSGICFFFWAVKHCLAHSYFLWAFSTCLRSHDHSRMSCFLCRNMHSCKTADSTQGNQTDELHELLCFISKFWCMLVKSFQLFWSIDAPSDWQHFFSPPILFFYVHNWLLFLCVWSSLRGSRMWWTGDRSHTLGAASLACELAWGACKDWADVVLLCRSLS